MSTETLPSKPTEDTGGLNPQDEYIAKQNYRRYQVAVDLNEQGKHYRANDHSSSIARALGSHARQALREKSEIADRLYDARKHYEKNEAAYQEQAVRDAAAKGIETNFGTDSIE